MEIWWTARTDNGGVWQRKTLLFHHYRIGKSNGRANPVCGIHIKKSQVYENRIPSLDHAIGRKNELVCVKTPHDHITSSLWKKCFPDDYIEEEYSKYNFCTFNFIIDLIERKTGEKFSINEIKNQLYDEYKKYIPDNTDKILDILITEGKKTLGDQVHSGTLSFASFIYTDNYFLTTFDLWLLVNKYKIPTIFLSQKCTKIFSPSN